MIVLSVSQSVSDSTVAWFTCHSNSWGSQEWTIWFIWGHINEINWFLYICAPLWFVGCISRFLWFVLVMCGHLWSVILYHCFCGLFSVHVLTCVLCIYIKIFVVCFPILLHTCLWSCSEICVVYSLYMCSLVICDYTSRFLWLVLLNVCSLVVCGHKSRFLNKVLNFSFLFSCTCSISLVLQVGCSFQSICWRCLIISFMIIDQDF